MTILRLIVAEFIYSGIRDIDMCCSMSNIRAELDYFGDKFIADKDDEITIYLVNINSLRKERWKAKNDQVRDFILSTKADIVVF